VKASVKEKEIKKLKEKVELLEVKVDSDESNTKKLSFKCTVCDFTCKSEKVLSNHMTRKHKEETLREVRYHDSSLEMSPTICQRSEEASDSVCSGLNTTHDCSSYKCPLCEEYFIEENYF
jgi:hypothetical protein